MTISLYFSKGALKRATICFVALLSSSLALPESFLTQAPWWIQIEKECHDEILSQCKINHKSYRDTNNLSLSSSKLLRISVRKHDLRRPRTFLKVNIPFFIWNPQVRVQIRRKNKWTYKHLIHIIKPIWMDAESKCEKGHI